MNNTTDNASESSLPTRPFQPIPSSPPVQRPLRSSPPLAGSQHLPFVEQDWSFGNMDHDLRTKSEPPLTQDEEPTKSVLKRMSSEGTERPPSAQQQHVASNGHADEQDDIETEDEELDSDPAEAITNFDWDDLMMRYHHAMDKCTDEEGKLAEEWDSLMSYFRIWAESGHVHETDRTYQRLRTRATYVQNSEDRLEQTRNHYINVVKAFESALNLLKVHGFGR